MKSLLFIVLFTLIINSNSYSSEQSSEIKIVTLNTWMIPFQRKMAKARAEIIGTEVKNHDIAFFQEAFTKGIRRTIATFAQQSQYFNRYQVNSSFHLNSGKFTLGKYKITQTDFQRFTRCGGIQCFAAKGILYVQFELPNGDLIDTFNTHLQAYQKDSKVRETQLEDAIAFINRKNTDGRPALFVGDFNIIAETAEYSIIQNKLYDFRDAWAEKRPGEPGYTWDPNSNYWAKYDYDETVQTQRLDYIFLRDGDELHWNIKDINIAFNKELPWSGVYKTPRKTFASDHFGLAATLVLE